MRVFRIIYSECKAFCRIREFCIFVRSHIFFHPNFGLLTESITSIHVQVDCAKDKNQNFYWSSLSLFRTYHFYHSLMHSQHQSQNNILISHPFEQSILYFSKTPPTIFSKIGLKLPQNNRKIHPLTQYLHFHSALLIKKNFEEGYTSAWSWKCSRQLYLIQHSYQFEFCSFG